MVNVVLCAFSFNDNFSPQVLVGQTAVPSIHRLEQVSSEEKVGSLAENLLEALREHPDVEMKVFLTCSYFYRKLILGVNGLNRPGESSPEKDCCW